MSSPASEEVHPVFLGIDSPATYEGFPDILEEATVGPLAELRRFAETDAIPPLDNLQEMGALIGRIGSCIATVVAVKDIQSKKISRPEKDGANTPAPNFCVVREVDPLGNKKQLEVRLEKGDSEPAIVSMGVMSASRRGGRRQQQTVKLPGGRSELTVNNCFAVDYTDSGIVFQPTQRPEAAHIQQGYISTLQRCINEFLLYFPETPPAAPENV